MKMKRELIHLENIVKKFEDLTVLDEIDVQIRLEDITLTESAQTRSQAL